MPRLAAATQRVFERRAPQRQIGPVGTATRLAGGAVAIAVPILLDGFSWWDALGALVLLPLIAAIAATAIRVVYPAAVRTAAAGPALCSVRGCVLVVVMVAANSGLAAVTPIEGNVSIWVWLGGSMLLAALAGYGGCEVLALPNLLTGRNDQIGCLLYTPVDRWEAARSSGSKPVRPQARST
jgi:hypothetical protein